MNCNLNFKNDFKLYYLNRSTIYNLKKFKETDKKNMNNYRYLFIKDIKMLIISLIELKRFLYFNYDINNKCVTSKEITYIEKALLYKIK